MTAVHGVLRRVTPTRRAIAGGLGVNVGLVLPGFLAASMAVRIDGDFTFGTFELGVALAIFYAVSAIFSAPLGGLVDRIGAARGLYAACALGVASTVGVAAFASSAVTLTALLIPCALAKAGSTPGVAALMASDIPDRRQGVAFGLQHSAPPAGALVAGLALPGIALPFGWRWAFVAAAVIIVAAGLALPRGAVRRAPRARPSLPVGSRGLRPVHLVAVAAALASAAGVGMFSFLVPFGVSIGLSDAEAGLLLASTSFVAVVSRVGVGVLADRRRGNFLAQAAALLAVCAAGFLLMAPGITGLVLCGAVLAGGVGWAWQALAGLAVVLGNASAPGQAAGIQMTGFFVGAVVGPLLVSTLAAQGGYGLTWVTCAGLVVLASLTAVAASRLQEAPVPGVGAA